MTGKRILAAIVLCGEAAAVVLAAPSAPPQGLSRHVQYSFTLHNTAARMAERTEFWAYGPVRNTATQTCTAWKADSPCDVALDSRGNQILHFVFTNLPPYATKIIRIDADVALADAPAECPGGDGYLGQEPLIEIDEPAFRLMAPAFPAAERATLARAIFEWVTANVRDEGYLARDRGALYALRERKGDCTEFMALFVALCRRNGIPARGVGGYVCDRDQILTPGAYHHWAEFHDGQTWRIADVQRKVLGGGGSRYVAMQILGAADGPIGESARFRCAGAGVKARMD